MKFNNKIKTVLIKIGTVFSCCYVGAFVLNCFLNTKFKFVFDIKLLANLSTIKLWFFLLFIFCVVYLMHYHKHFWLNRGNKIMTSNDKDSDIKTNLEGAKWQSESDLNKNFCVLEFDALATSNAIGMPIKALQSVCGKIVSKKSPRYSYKIVLAPPAHTLVIGTTGSGKTTSFINPTVQILAECKSKPSMIISDPKGELYKLHAKSLADKNYTVKVLDLRNPFCSVGWNPLQRPYEIYHKMLNIESQARMIEYKGCWLFENTEYYDFSQLQTVFKIKKQEMLDEIYEDLNDIASVLCPIKNKQEPLWDSGAKNFCLAIMLAMLEDSGDQNLLQKLDEKDRMDITKFNFYNVKNIASNTDDEFRELIKYFSERSLTSKCVALSKQVLDSADKTRASYISNLFDKLNLFSDISLCSLTSRNDNDFDDFVEKPTALFLQIPDEKDTRHTIASMFILQAYKELVRQANSSNNLSLSRDVFFVLDEFGNMPAIHKLEQIITVGRSRKIWLIMVVQSYAQLAKVYDEKVAEIIKSNCNIQCFIGSTDQKTIDDFSKKCGNKSVVTRSVGYNSAVPQDFNSNASIKERPLIYPIELQQLNKQGDMGNAIVTVFGYQPIKSKFTPSFECKAFNLEPIKQEKNINSYFDEERVFYDISKRNNALISTNSHKNLKGKVGFNKDYLNRLNNLACSIPTSVEQLFDAPEQIKFTTLLQNGNVKELLEMLKIAKERAVSFKEHDVINEIDKLFLQVEKILDDEKIN